MITRNTSKSNSAESLKAIKKRAKTFADNYCVGDATMVIELLRKVAFDSYVQGAKEQQNIIKNERFK